MTNRHRPLLKDVAALAEVSLTTVSIVLNGRAGTNIPAVTRARVAAAAAELGYRPNAMARSLRRQRSDTIAVISDEIATTPFAGAMLQGAQDAAWTSGIVILLANTGRDRDIEARAIEIMLDRQVDAIVYATMSHRIVAPPAGLHDIRTVLLGGRTADASLPSVVPDESGAARSAVQTLIEHGHRRIGWVTTAEPGPATFERLAGYRSMLEEHGIAFDPSLVEAGPGGDTHSGLDAAGRLLDRPDRPTALFCFNDRMAMGAYRAIRLRGLRIPDDISVVGFDNMEQIAPWLDPPLTTMQLPHYEMGRWAVEQVLRGPWLEAETEIPTQCRMPCPRIERASVAAPRPTA